MADNEDTIIIWAADGGVHWPIEGFIQHTHTHTHTHTGVKIRILLLKSRTRLRFSHHLQEALRFVTSVFGACKVFCLGIWEEGAKLG